MWAFGLFLFLGLLPLEVLSHSLPQNREGLGIDELAGIALKNLKAFAQTNGSVSTASCTGENVMKRREWGDLSKAERKDYIDAVLCLSKKPAITPLAEFPGVRSRYDDFVATHINQTLNIHATSKFLPWHRYYVWAYENALRTECGYKGTQPYYNWAQWANNPEASPMLDGSETSMSGNGAYIANLTPTDDAPVLPPRGQGGGCVQSGPFTNFTVNLGPIATLWKEIPENPDATSAKLHRIPGGRGYNPRCLRRDILKQLSMHATSDANVTDLITNNNDYTSFQTAFESVPNATDKAVPAGVHFGGHYTWGGDPGGDFFTSPGDPAFWLHHASIDRTWWTWQNLKPETRTYEVGMTLTMNNQPPSRKGELDDGVDLGLNGREYRVRDLVSSLGGPFCYVYE